MNENEALVSAWDVVKRQWWLVAVAVCAALVVGVLLGRGGGAVYDGTTTLLIDYPAIARYKGVPTADDAIRYALSAALREDVAAASGPGPGIVVSGLRVSSTGNPQNRLVITYSSTDKGQAAAGAKVVADAIIDYARRRASVEIKSAKFAVAAAEGGIAALNKATAGAKLTPWQRADDAFKVSQMGKDAAEARGILEILLSTYSLESGPSVSTRSAASGTAATLAGAALVGLIAGLLIAAARESMSRRRERA